MDVPYGEQCTCPEPSRGTGRAAAGNPRLSAPLAVRRFVAGPQQLSARRPERGHAPAAAAGRRLGIAAGPGGHGGSIRRVLERRAFAQPWIP